MNLVYKDFMALLLDVYNKTFKQPVNYNNVLTSYNVPDSIRSYCAEITFINKGASTVIVNHTLPLLPEQAISFDGKKYERDTTIYNVGFTGAGTNLCIVIRKYYNDQQ